MDVWMGNSLFSGNFFRGCIVWRRQRQGSVLPCDTGAVGWCAQRQVNVKEAGGKEIWAKKMQAVHLQNSGGTPGAHVLYWGLLGNFFSRSAGVQEHSNALIFSVWKVSDPSDSKRRNTACSEITQMRCELSCVPVDHFGMIPLETTRPPSVQDLHVLPLKPGNLPHIVGCFTPPLHWDYGAGNGIRKPTTPKEAEALGHKEFSAALVLPRSPAACWVMGFLIIPNKYKPGGWIVHSNNSPANINIPLLVIRRRSLSSPLKCFACIQDSCCKKFCKASVSVCFPLNYFQIPICRVCRAHSELHGRKRRWVEPSP